MLDELYNVMDVLHIEKVDRPVQSAFLNVREILDYISEIHQKLDDINEIKRGIKKDYYENQEAIELITCLNRDRISIDNIHELQRSIYDFQVSHEDAPTLENYLQDISLYTDNDSIDQGQYVSLMSIHMAKGLEFDYVFVLGLSEGIFPSFRSLAEDGDDGLEEERRLAYVAFTRARKQLFLTDSEGFSFVTDSPKISSRFIDEVGNEGIIHSGSKPRFKTTDYVPKQTVSKAELIGDNKVDDWKVGDLVNHDIFGKGVVVKVNKNILDIAFELPAGLKSLMANHKALKKLTN